MPILKPEPDIYPSDLLDLAGSGEMVGRKWWALYTRHKHEKMLMRRLAELRVPFYAPMIKRQYRSPAGRLRVSYRPLLTNYVFILGTESDRYDAVCTSCVSRWFSVPNQEQLVADLRHIQRLIQTGQPITPEARLTKGNRVRVRNGPFAGFEGIVLRRERETRLLIAVDFARQGASVLLEECQLEPI